tara:strand:- start:1153 stop:2379 length:1227 start_codon:yes stop_codon:yes gene_type:complete
MWAAEGDASKATKATNVYKCFTPEACVLSDDAASISCNTKDGYKAKGVLCGECDGDFVRSGRKCATCYENWISTTLTALIGLIVFGIVVYLVVEHSFDAARGALAPVIKKVALSHLQLLGVLGVFKAKGTSTFNTIISKPAEVGGGSLTKLQPISCTIGGEWQAYGGFILNMSMPPVVLSVAALLVLPTWLIIGARQRKRTIEDAPTFGPKYGLPIIVGTMCGHLRRAATEGEKRTWAANFDPRSRFIGVAIFILFGLYPSLVGSVASMLNCVTVNETAVLIADVSIVCWEGTTLFSLVSPSCLVSSMRSASLLCLGRASSFVARRRRGRRQRQRQRRRRRRRWMALTRQRHRWMERTTRSARTRMGAAASSVGRRLSTSTLRCGNRLAFFSRATLPIAALLSHGRRW